MTPWAWCIKEGVEPRRFQKRFNPSHVQVSLLLCSLSPPSLALFCFCCLYYNFSYYYNVYLLVKGFIITVENKPGPKYSNGKDANLDIKLAKHSLPFLSLSSQWPLYVFRLSNPYNMPAELVALCVFRLSNPHNINSFASLFFSSLSSQWSLYVFRLSNPYNMPAELVALCVFRLSNPHNINSFAPLFFSSLSLLNGHCMCSGSLTHTICQLS